MSNNNASSSSIPSSLESIKDNPDALIQLLSQLMKENESLKQRLTDIEEHVKEVETIQQHEPDRTLHTEYFESREALRETQQKYTTTLTNVNSIKTQLLQLQLEEKQVNKVETENVLPEASSIIEYNTDKKMRDEKQEDQFASTGDNMNPFLNRQFITVKVGQQKYLTSRKTLVAEDSILKTMVTQNYFAVDVDEEGFLVVNYNSSKHFPLILKYLQYHSIEMLDIPLDDENLLITMLEEFQFFNIEPLKQYVEDNLNNLRKKHKITKDTSKDGSDAYLADLEDTEEFESLLRLKFDINKMDKHDEYLREKLQILQEEESSLTTTLTEYQSIVDKLYESNTESITKDLTILFNENIRFVIPREVLTKPQMAGSLFITLYNFAANSDLSEVFLDRDPQLFEAIYQYIKNNFRLTKEISPKTEVMRNILQKEAQFYQLKTLLEHLNPFRYPFEELGPENVEMKEKEDALRTMFVKDKKNPILEDPEIMLIPVLECLDDLKTDPQVNLGELLFDFEDRSYSRYLFEVSPHIPTIITNPKHFFRNFACNTRNILRSMDWNNVIVAGGAVLASLLQPPDMESSPEYVSYLHYLDAYFNQRHISSTSFADSDIDLFLYGLDEQQAKDKIRKIYNCIRKNSDDAVLIIRSKFAITFQTKDRKPIQIILRIYKSPAEVLCGFDIDSCCVAFNGKDVLCLPRFARAIRTRTNIVDVDRQSKNYELRLYKYALRGFRVCIAGFNRKKVKKQGIAKGTIFPIKCLLKNTFGLAKLLLLERKFFDPASNRPTYSANPRKYKKEMEMESDYLGSYIRPNVGTSALELKQQYDNSSHYVAFKFAALLNDINSIIDGKPFSIMQDPVKFETIEPTTQRVGSFHPVSFNFLMQAYCTNEEYAVIALEQKKAVTIKWYYCQFGYYNSFSRTNKDLLERLYLSGNGDISIKVTEGTVDMDIVLNTMTATLNLSWGRRHSKLVRVVEVLEPVQ
jgi:hypothetical protein